MPLLAQSGVEIDGYRLCALGDSDLARLGIADISLRTRLLTAVDEMRSRELVTTKDCSKWTSEELFDYFEKMRLGQQARGLRLQGVAGRDLPTLGGEQLARAGVVSPAATAAILKVLQGYMHSLWCSRVFQAAAWAVNSSGCTGEPVQRWSAHAVQAWLDDVGLQAYSTPFAQHAVDGPALLRLDPDRVAQIVDPPSADLLAAITRLQAVSNTLGCS